jgi:Fur family ferric uptake transcriptional regulator
MNFATQLQILHNPWKCGTTFARMNMKLKSTAADSREHQLHDIQATKTLAESQLRRASIRITRVRVKVLAALLAAKRAFSHQEIQDTFADMDRVTLYRALDCLTEAGLAHKISGDDRIFRYSAGNDHADRNTVSPTGGSIAQHQHGHFKCTLCAKVFCLEKSDAVFASGASAKSVALRSTWRQQLENELQKTLGEGFRSHEIELTIKGWCADCAH